MPDVLDDKDEFETTPPYVRDANVILERMQHEWEREDRHLQREITKLKLMWFLSMATLIGGLILASMFAK